MNPDNVKHGRTWIVSKLLGDVEKSIQTVVSGGGDHNFCKNNIFAVADSKDCTARLLGQLMRDLHGHELWPLPLSADSQLTPIALTKTIVDLVNIPPSKFVRTRAAHHLNCRAVSMPNAKNNDDGDYVPHYVCALAEADELYMAKQAKQLGTNGVMPGAAKPNARTLWPY